MKETLANLHTVNVTPETIEIVLANGIVVSVFPFAAGLEIAVTKEPPIKSYSVVDWTKDTTKVTFNY